MTNMGSSANQDKKDIEKYIKFFCHKSTQVIVQGRLGKLISTESASQPSGAEWFYLAIKDYQDIRHEVKAALRNGIPHQDKSIVTEISLRTSDADSLILEVWAVGVLNSGECSRDRLTIYNRMSMLLKSLLCLSRITPAYRLSRNQGSEYVLCYRVYMGKVCLDGLGDGFKTLHVGSVASPVGTITMSSAYRSVENLHVTSREKTPKAPLLFPMKSDHFAHSNPSTAAHPCHTLTSRFRTSSEASDASSTYGSQSPVYYAPEASCSISPISKDKARHGAMFTVGTPPEPLGSQRNRHSCGSISGLQAHSLGQFRHPSNPIMMPVRSQDPHPTSKVLKCGYSAPTVDIGRFSATSPTYPVSRTLQSARNRRRGSDTWNDNAGDVPSCGVTYRHWSNENVTKVKAGKAVSPPTVSRETSLASVEQAKSSLSWDQPSAGGRKYSASQLPFQAGAFVSGSKTAALAQKAVADADAAVSPFSALLNNSNLDDTSDDNSSEKSDSDAAHDDTDRGNVEKNRPTARLSESKSSLSSEASVDSSSTEKGSRYASDDFVMVDLNPAFGRGDSVTDLGTFYRECEHVPELVMFKEQNGTENDETLLDLTKQLEDYQQDTYEFDAFVLEIQAAK